MKWDVGSGKWGPGREGVGREKSWLCITAKRKPSLTPLTAAGKGQLDVVKLLLQAGADVNEKAADGRTALNRSAGEGHAAVVKELLRAGAMFNSSDTERRRSALSWAAGNGHLDVVSVLLQASVDINHKDIHGNTPLSWSAIGGHLDVVAVLTQAGKEELAP
jgi:ankyrin repeat protein